jgi:hypothetical protein
MLLALRAWSCSMESESESKSESKSEWKWRGWLNTVYIYLEKGTTIKIFKNSKNKCLNIAYIYILKKGTTIKILKNSKNKCLNIVYIHILEKGITIWKFKNSRNISFFIEKWTDLHITFILYTWYIFYSGFIYHIYIYTTYRVFMIYNGTLRATKSFASCILKV